VVTILVVVALLVAVALVVEVVGGPSVHNGSHAAFRGCSHNAVT
jgi:hypothetical protein